MSAGEANQQLKLRPRELFFALVGVVGSAGAFVLWFRAVPELMKTRGVQLEELSELGQFVMTLGFQVSMLVFTFVMMAGGYATRTTFGNERGTWIFALGASTIVLALVLSVAGLGDLLGPDPATMVRP